MTRRAVNGKSAIFVLLLELLYFFVSLGNMWFGGNRWRLGDAAWSFTIRPASSLTLGSQSTIFSFIIWSDASYAEQFWQGTGTFYVKCPARCLHLNKIVLDMCTWFFFHFYFLLWKTNKTNYYHQDPTLLWGKSHCWVCCGLRTLLSLVADGYQIAPRVYASFSCLLPGFPFFFNKSEDFETLGQKKKKSHRD